MRKTRGRKTVETLAGKLWQLSGLDHHGNEWIVYALGFRRRCGGWLPSGPLVIHAAAGKFQVRRATIKTKEELLTLKIALSLASANSELLARCNGERRYTERGPRQVMEGYIHFRERRFQ